MAATSDCRLCSFSCNEFKSLFDDTGQTTETYEIAVKYFNPSLLNSGTERIFGVICAECWQHISNFHSFQEWVLNAQAEQEDIIEIITYNDKLNDQLNDQLMSPERKVSLDFSTDINFDLASSTYSTKLNNSKLNAKSYESDRKEESNDSPDFKLKGELECGICKELFGNYNTLSKHFQQVHSDSQYSVNCCQQKFNKSWKLAEHRRDFHNGKDENYYKCPTCGASFSQYGSLRRHIRKKHLVKPLLKWNCNYCNKRFKNCSSLVRHKSQVHSRTHVIDNDTKLDLTQTSNSDEEENFGFNDKIKSVQEPNQILNDEENEFILNELLNEEDHTKKEQSKSDCVPCNSVEEKNIHSDSDDEVDVFETSTNGQIHMPALEIVDIKNEICVDSDSESDSHDQSEDLLSKTFSSDAEKNKMYDDFIAKRKGDLECPKCARLLTNYTLLSKHFELDHPKEPCYIVCCRKIINDRNSLVEHLQHHQKPSMAIECVACGKFFKSEKGLTSHKLQVHTDKRSAYHLHLCYCKRAKERHAQNKTNDQQISYDTVVCCQRKKKILEDDALIAEWKKELKCRLCKATFLHYSTMRAHFYHEHPGEKCYIVCCQRKISRISDALEHIRFHLDPHAYRCKICAITFSGKSSLSKHMRNTHLDSLPKHKWACDECDKTFEIRQILTRHKNVFHSKQV